jgi:hypothetical protein
MHISRVLYRTHTSIFACTVTIAASLAAATHCGSDDEAPTSGGRSGSSGTSGTTGSAGSAGVSGTQGASGTSVGAGSGGTAGGDSSIEPQPDSGEADAGSDAEDAPDAEDAAFDPTVHGSLKTSAGQPFAGSASSSVATWRSAMPMANS